MWPFSKKGASGFNWYSTAEEVTEGIDGSGLTAIVTGASSGIGAETVRVLALRGVHVIMSVRNLAAGGKVKEAILKETPSAKLDVLELDLTSFASIRKFASEFEGLNRPLNILINNAGIMATPFSLSHDGYELQFATNHLGHFLLTNLLLESMKRASSDGKKEGRIVIVSSEAHRLFGYTEGIRFDKINEESGYNSIQAYGQSKLANVLHANELSQHLREEGVQITANSLHPGSILTNLLRYHSIIDFVARTAGKLLLKNVQQGAATTCYVALHPQVRGISGKYFNNSSVHEGSTRSTDTELAKKLWDFSMRAVN